MIVVDTSSWIEWLIDSETGARIEALLPARDEIIVPTLVQLELTKWLMRTRGEDVADEVLAFTEKCRVIPLDTPLAIAAADISRKHGLATADAIIFATAQQERNFDVLIEEAGLADRGTFVVDPEGKIQIVEITAGGVGRSATELLRKIKAAQYVASHPGEVCPAKWQEGEKTLAPSLDLVGKI